MIRKLMALLARRLAKSPDVDERRCLEAWGDDRADWPTEREAV